MDIEELKRKLDEQNKELDKLKSKESDAVAEIERMREHQKSLLEETKAAKDAKKDALSQIEKLSSKMEEFEKNGLIHEGNYKELFDKETEKLKLSYESKLEDANKSINTMTEQFNGLKMQYSSEKINGVLRSAAEKANVIPSAIDDVLFRASGIFNIGDDGSIESRDKDGNLRKVGNKQLTPESFVDSLKESAPHLWPASEGAGASGGSGGGRSKSNPWAKDTFNRTEQAKIMNSDPDLGAQLKKEATAS